MRAKLPTSWLSTSPNGGSASGGSSASNGFVRGVSVAWHAREREHVHVRLVGVRARTRAHDREHVGEHEHGDVREQVVLLHVEHVVVAVRREVDALRRGSRRAPCAASIPRSVSPSGIGGHRARRRSSTPMRPPITSTNDANTSSSAPGRPWRGDGRPYDCTSRPWRCQITCGPLTSSAMPSISRWMPCTWYVSLKPSMSVFQLQSACTEMQRLAAELVEVRPRGLGGHRSRNSASGSASGSRFTKTIGPHVSTCTAMSGKSSLSTPNSRRDGTSRSRPSRSQVQRWNGQRISARPVPVPLHSSLPR